jgi:hypothetical protein
MTESVYFSWDPLLIGLPFVNDGVVANLRFGVAGFSFVHAVTEIRDSARHIVERANGMESSTERVEGTDGVWELTPNPPQPRKASVPNVSRTCNDSLAHDRACRRRLVSPDFDREHDEIVVAGAYVHQRQPLDDGYPLPSLVSAELAPRLLRRG